MTFEIGIKLAFIAAVICYLLEMIWMIQQRNRVERRIEIAKQNNWVVQANCVKTKTINTAKHEDFKKNKSRLVHIYYYEYEINGVKKRLKMTSASRMPYTRELYYDAEDNNKILDIKNRKLMKMAVLLPIIVFFSLAILIRIIFHV